MSSIFPIGFSLDSIENVLPHLLSSVEKPRTHGLRNILQALPSGSLVIVLLLKGRQRKFIPILFNSDCLLITQISLFFS